MSTQKIWMYFYTVSVLLYLLHGLLFQMLGSPLYYVLICTLLLRSHPSSQFNDSEIYTFSHLHILTRTEAAHSLPKSITLFFHRNQTLVWHGASKTYKISFLKLVVTTLLICLQRNVNKYDVCHF